MRSCFAVALLAMLSWIGQDARAGVTIDVVFQDGTGHVLSIWSADWVSFGHLGGPGCTFSGYYANTISHGRCMDVFLRSTHDLISVSTSVDYESNDGLGVESFHEWRSVGVSFDKGGNPVKECIPTAGVSDDGSRIGSFDCEVPPPNLTTPLPPGTYKIGTIVWDTAGMTGEGDTQTIEASMDGLLDGVSAVIDGNVVDLTASVVLESAVVNVIVAVCGNGVVAPTEACDDGDTTPGDGCNGSCEIEPGWTCAGAPSSCSVCGDGGIGGTEECDDGGTAPGDGCDATCRIEKGWGCSHEPSLCRELLPVPSVGTTGTAVLVFGIAVLGLLLAARKWRG
jgi:cysteine-rich repeat protein